MTRNTETVTTGDSLTVTEIRFESNEVQRAAVARTPGTHTPYVLHVNVHGGRPQLAMGTVNVQIDAPDRFGSWGPGERTWREWVRRFVTNQHNRQY